MSKIYVDKMPKTATECPFVAYKTDDDGMLLCACKGLEYSCSLEHDAKCEHLIEFPKEID